MDANAFSARMPANMSGFWARAASPIATRTALLTGSDLKASLLKSWYAQFRYFNAPLAANFRGPLN